MKKGLTIFLLALGMLTTRGPSVVAASNGLEFYPSKVYFSDDNTLAIEGNFFNEYAPFMGQAKVAVDVKLLMDKGWQSFHESFPNVNIEISRNGACSWTFYIHGVNKVDFASWKVKTNIF